MDEDKIKNAHEEAITLKILAEAFLLLNQNPMITEEEVRELMWLHGLVDNKEIPSGRKF